MEWYIWNIVASFIYFNILQKLWFSLKHSSYLLKKIKVLSSCLMLWSTQNINCKFLWIRWKYVAIYPVFVKLEQISKIVPTHNKCHTFYHAEKDPQLKENLQPFGYWMWLIKAHCSRKSSQKSLNHMLSNKSKMVLFPLLRWTLKSQKDGHSCDNSCDKLTLFDTSHLRVSRYVASSFN